MPEMVKRDADDRVPAVDLTDFLSQYSGQEIKVQIVRMEPSYFKGHKTKGTLETVDELIDEQTLRERFGGGKYQLRVMRRNSKGNMQFATSTVVDIAGNPIVPDDGGGEPSNGNGHRTDTAGAQLAGRALDVMHQNLKEIREEAKEEKKSSGIDHTLIEAMMRPVQAQLDAAQRANEKLQELLARKEERLLDTIEAKSRPADAPPGGTFTDRMLEKMVDGESSRIQSLRANHESELRQLRQQSDAQLERERDRLKDDQRSREDAHRRELDMMKSTHQTMLEATKTSLETRIDGLKAEVSRLQSEFGAVKTENAELRAKKEKPLVEQAKEIAQVRDALKEISGDNDDDDEGKSAIERIAGHVFNNPEAIGQIFGGVRGAIAPGPSPEQQAQLEQQAQQQAAYAHAMQVRQLAKKRKRAAARAAAGVQQPAPEGVEQPETQTQEAPVELPNVSAAETMQAIALMENAVAAGTDPVAFAMSVRSFVPGELLRFIERVGPDQFLDHVGLNDSSVLRTQRGRNFTREAFAALLSGG